MICPGDNMTTCLWKLDCNCDTFLTIVRAAALSSPARNPQPLLVAAPLFAPLICVLSVFDPLHNARANNWRWNVQFLWNTRPPLVSLPLVAHLPRMARVPASREPFRHTVGLEAKHHNAANSCGAQGLGSNSSLAKICQAWEWESIEIPVPAPTARRRMTSRMEELWDSSVRTTCKSPRDVSLGWTTSQNLGRNTNGAILSSVQIQALTDFCLSQRLRQLRFLQGSCKNMELSNHRIIPCVSVIRPHKRQISGFILGTHLESHRKGGEMQQRWRLSCTDSQKALLRLTSIDSRLLPFFPSYKRLPIVG